MEGARLVSVARDIAARRNHRRDADIILIDDVTGCRSNDASPGQRQYLIRLLYYVLSLVTRDVTDDVTRGPTVRLLCAIVRCEIRHTVHCMTVTRQLSII